MPVYKAPLRDMRFVIHELLEVEKHSNLPIFSEAPADIIDAVLEEGAKVAEEILFPLNQVGHEEGCTFNDGVVTTPTGFKEGFAEYRQAGRHCRKRHFPPPGSEPVARPAVQPT